MCLNLLFRDTYVERKAGESINDRNDRAIRVATDWYEKHLAPEKTGIGKKKNNHLRVVLLTDDADNLRKAENENLLVCTGGS
jgi:exosome complex exonuclease DIS3/RRP44